MRSGDSGVLLTGFDEAEAAELAELLGDLSGAPPLVCLGPELSGPDAARFIEQALAGQPDARFVILAAGDEPERFQDFIDADAVYFLSRRPPPLPAVAALLRSALRPAHPRAPLDLDAAKTISRAVDRIATETGLERISALLGYAVATLTHADEARFAIYNSSSDTLWFRGLEDRGVTRDSAASGLAGFALRAAEAVLVERAGDDPRYDAEADNAGRSPQERFLAVPVTLDGTIGVLVATRAPQREPFTDADQQRLASLALQIAPIVRHRLDEQQSEESLASADDPVTADGEPLYRREALRAHLKGAAGEPGPILDLNRSQPAHKAPRRRGKSEVPFIQQTTRADCGAACMAMVLSSFGKQVPLHEVREVMGMAGDGADARQILTAAEWYSLRARAVRVPEVEHLESLPSRSILHWQFHHFVVLERTTREGAFVVDPAIGPRMVPWSELRTAFTGIAVTLEPSADFVPEDRRGSGWKRYVRCVAGEHATLIGVIATSSLLQLLALALPLLTGILVDRVVPRDDVSLLALLALGTAAVVVFHFLATLIRSRVLLRLRVQLDSWMTLDFLEHLVDLPYSFFQQRSAGDLMSRLHINATIREILASGVLSGALDVLLVGVYLILAIVIHPLLGLLVLALGALRVLLFLAMRRQHQDVMSRSFAAEAASRTYQAQMLAGIETLKSFGAERRAVEHWSNLFADELNVALDRGRLNARFDALLSALTTASPFAILLYGAFEVIRGQLTLGMMLAVSALAAGFFAPLSTLVSTALQMQMLRSYLGRIDDVLEAPPEQPRGTPLARPRLAGRITVDRVSFRYNPTAPLVVDDVSLDIPAGSFVALVGPSGAGKTTLAHLLAGLYRPTTGRILYDGRDLATLDLRAVRSQLGIVNQQPHLFDGSLASNLSLPDPSLPRQRLIEAARIAQIHDDILQLPLGYDSMLGDGGLTFSGGQRQRLALARALVHKPAILLLDEATSSLDTATERRIQDELAALRCTRIVIAHRLSTVRAADVILVMDEGKLVERGSHDELMARRGTYEHLVAVQLQSA